MSNNQLNDISKVYMEKSTVVARKRRKITVW